MKLKIEARKGDNEVDDRDRAKIEKVIMTISLQMLLHHSNQTKGVYQVYSVDLT